MNILKNEETKKQQIKSLGFLRREKFFSIYVDFIFIKVN